MQKEKSMSQGEMEADIESEIIKNSCNNSTASSGGASTTSPSCSPLDETLPSLTMDPKGPIDNEINDIVPSDLNEEKKNETNSVEITQIPILNTEPTTTTTSTMLLVVTTTAAEATTTTSSSSTTEMLLVNDQQEELLNDNDINENRKDREVGEGEQKGGGGDDDESSTSSLSSSDMDSSSSDESLGSYTVGEEAGGRGGGGAMEEYNDDSGGDANAILNGREQDAKASAIASSRFDATFMHYYKQLKAFHEKFGHTKVTPKYDKKLAGYCADIRNARRHPDANYGRNFKEKHFKAFDELGFVWNPKKEGDEKSFDYRIQQLKAFKEKYGHLRPTKKHDTNLAHFVANIRKARRNPERAIRVTDDRIKALDAIGFEWEPKPTQGDMNFWSHIEKLRAFKREHGHSLVTHKHDKKLAVFCNNMRVAKRGSVTTRRLTAERIKALDDLDFIWEPGLGKTAADFIDLVSQLKKFKKTFGHYSVTAEHDRKLSDFCTKMRIAYKSPGTGLASADRIKVLDDMGFDWEPKHDNFFDVCFDKLKAIKETGGDILEAEKSNPDLAKFCKCMRQARRHLEAEEGITSIELSGRIKELDAIGFSWGER